MCVCVCPVIIFKIRKLDKYCSLSAVGYLLHLYLSLLCGYRGAPRDSRIYIRPQQNLPSTSKLPRFILYIYKTKVLLLEQKTKGEQCFY